MHDCGSSGRSSKILCEARIFESVLKTSSSVRRRHTRWSNDATTATCLFLKLPKWRVTVSTAKTSSNDFANQSHDGFVVHKRERKKWSPVERGKPRENGGRFATYTSTPRRMTNRIFHFKPRGCSCWRIGAILRQTFTAWNRNL